MNEWMNECGDFNINYLSDNKKKIDIKYLIN